MCRYVDHIATIFGRRTGQKRGYCGHEEIELALVKLYRGDERQEIISNWPGTSSTSAAGSRTISMSKPARGARTPGSYAVQNL